MGLIMSSSDCHCTFMSCEQSHLQNLQSVLSLPCCVFTSGNYTWCLSRCSFSSCSDMHSDMFICMHVYTSFFGSSNLLRKQLDFFLVIRKCQLPDVSLGLTEIICILWGNWYLEHCKYSVFGRDITISTITITLVLLFITIIIISTCHMSALSLNCTPRITKDQQE